MEDFKDFLAVDEFFNLRKVQASLKVLITLKLLQSF